MGSVEAPKSKLFSPLRIGRNTLEHRIVLAPLTRMRATDSHAHNVPLATEYYTQRAATPGTLLITEATYISPRGVGYPNVPGIWSEEQIAAWKEIVSAVHAKGSYIWLQLWSMGRAAPEGVRAAAGTRRPFAPSAIAIDSEHVVPDEMTEQEILETIEEFGQAAKNAVEGAGFDGVEIHAANGYLPDEFLQDTANQRTDGWGGSVEKRSRFVLEVTKAVVDAVGSDRTAIRLSPWSEFQAMRMADPVPQFSHVITGLKEHKLAYLHLVESRVNGFMDVERGESNKPFLDIWGKTSPVLTAGGYTAEKAAFAVEQGDYKDIDSAVVFGRSFIPNPDLVFRIQNNVPLVKYDRDTFYVPKEPQGYTTYDYSAEYKAAQKA